MLKITIVKSLIGFPEDQRRTAAALGLTKLQRTVLRPDNASVRGMAFKLRHVVEVQEVPDLVATTAEGTK
ncbi:MAG TPA: 50S ribosomal protein L30 [Capsulimonadaceae bacterium]|jgi:large subunit ribosomal protein L30